MGRYRVPILVVAPKGTEQSSVLTFRSVNQRDKAYRQLIEHGLINIGTTAKPDVVMLGRVANGFITSQYIFPNIKKELDDGSSPSNEA